MTTYSRVLLSGSTDGKPVPVAATTTPGTLIHTAVSGSTSFDEVYLYVSNVTGSAATLTIEWGSVTDPSGHISKAVSIPQNTGPTLVVPGITINNGAVVRAFSGTASALNITGHVNRITP